VAGLFYPKDPKELGAAVDRCLAEAKSKPMDNVRALVCPHAGYEYSGPVAGSAYQTIANAGFSRVIILAASHYALFQGVSVPRAQAYENPLG
jgi:MEMO1 family protein